MTHLDRVSILNALELNGFFVVNDSEIIIAANSDKLLVTIAIGETQTLLEMQVCPTSRVKDQNVVNADMMRLQTKIPLSNVGIGMYMGEESYILSGALSTQSSIDNFKTELELLISNTQELAEVFVEQYI